MIVAAKSATRRLRITLRGAVQGVGFRPFVFRLATELSLTGWVLNSSAGLMVEVEGPSEQLSRFEQRLEQERPKASVVNVREFAWLAAEGATRFEILASDHDSGKTVNVLPDLATCPDCREELFDPGNRRFEYPFTNCTNCGPRYTIVLDIPYDRPNTTMREFVLCPRCREEYESPADRRFHAQPNACPVCGPKLDGSLEDAVEALRQGEIVALKGIGGFQLLVDARNPAAVARLRERKHREEKPFALMMPSLVAIGTYALLLAWNEYLYAFLLLSSDKQITLSVALGNFLAADDSPWELLMTVGLVYAVPPALIYYVFKRYMVGGLTAGAVKS